MHENTNQWILGYTFRETPKKIKLILDRHEHIPIMSMNIPIYFSSISTSRASTAVNIYPLKFAKHSIHLPDIGQSPCFMLKIITQP
jgi:hypothetical protein